MLRFAQRNRCPQSLQCCLLAAILLSAAGGPALSAQTPSPAPLVQNLVVLGSPTPTPLAESPASVLVLPVRSNILMVQTPQDLLRRDASIFIQQRGAGGAQTDLLLRGGTFEQTLVLLNGFRINDSQTAHHNLDLPIPLDAMDSIEVLHGAGSTLYGEDALSGVVDFLTAAPSSSRVRLRAGLGSFGASEESLLAAVARARWSARLTATHNLSTGFMPDRDYRNQDVSLETWVGSRLGTTDLLLAASDRSFGANQFYGPYNSWERTKGWFASLRQELGPRTVAAFGYRRHTDEFVLLRDQPSVYENNHIDGSWQASLRRTVPLGAASVLLLGLESDGDGIRSNNLGLHARNRGAGYLDLDIRPTGRRWNLSAGLREEIFSGGARSVLSPHLAGSLRIAHQLKLRASGGYGFRIPTYTDLYYSDPTTNGNPDLKPESAWSGEAGFDWPLSSHLSFSATGFYSRQHDAIDYLRTPASPSAPASKWNAANLSGLRFAGVETTLDWSPARSQKIRIAWTGLAGRQGSLHGLQSEYALNYPVVNLHASWTILWGRRLAFTNELAIARPYQQPGIPPWNASPYPVWNAALARNAGRLRPYLRLDNLSNTGYQEIDGVAMPGRSITGGISFALAR